MAYSNLVLSFFAIFVIQIQLSLGALQPEYDLNKGVRKFFDVGKALKLECKVTEESEKSEDIKWSKKGEEKLDEEFFTKLEGQKSVLEKHKTTGKDDGTYYCKYLKKQFEFEVIANIVVKIKPTTDVAVVEGETLTLKCIGVGTKLKITWVYDDNITENARNLNENGTLEIKDVKKSYRGNYTCEGRHDDSLDIPGIVSSTAYVRVKDKYAALWPFILICIEVFILCAIILIYEKHRSHVEVEDSETEPEKNGKN